MADGGGAHRDSRTTGILASLAVWGITPRWHGRSSVGLLLVAGGLWTGGCGGGDGRPERRAPGACAARIAAAAGPHARARVVTREPQLVTCVYRAAAGAFRVTVDTLPQAWFRWERAQVERTQTASEWSHTPAQQPRDVPGVGGGAFWVRGPRELVASDGRRLISVRVLRPVAARPARRAAVRVARAGLGPVNIPGNTGP